MQPPSDPDDRPHADQTAVLFVTTCWWPSLARLIHLFRVAGFRVGVVCPPGHSALAVPGIAAFTYRALPARYCAVSDAIKAFQA